jgi:hypothetical protein
MDGNNGRTDIRYMTLQTNGTYLYVRATGSQGAFNLVWDNVLKGRPVRKADDLAELRGCLIIRRDRGPSSSDGPEVRNVWLASIDDLVRMALAESKAAATLEVPFERGERCRLDVVRSTRDLLRSVTP